MCKCEVPSIHEDIPSQDGLSTPKQESKPFKLNGENGFKTAAARLAVFEDLPNTSNGKDYS